MVGQVSWDVTGLPIRDIYEITQQPGFHGGKTALVDYLTHNLSYPDAALNQQLEGDVIVAFTIDKDGQILDAEILQGLGLGCDEEVLRLVEDMPDWTPAKIEGKQVACRYILPVQFRMRPAMLVAAASTPDPL